MSRTAVVAPNGNGFLPSILENAQFKPSHPSGEAPTPLAAPFSSFATASRVVKGEDVLYVHPLAIATQPHSMMYMVCDGHSGSEAANYVAANFVRILNSKLPAKAPSMSNSKEIEAFAEVVRRAVCETFVRLDNDWISVGHMAGTTVTAVIVIGYLLTAANVGDSSAVLDTGCSILELTGSHRIHTNQEEQARLRVAGCTLAPLGFHLQGPARPNELGVGPLRLWPGGLCVSRSVGDLDAGPEVVPIPHVRQVVLPEVGSRVIICSDGVWDLMSLSKAVKLARSKPATSATGALMAAVSRDMRLLDDASIIVLDMLPNEGTCFPTVALKANPRKPEKSGGLFACFRPELDEPDSRDLTNDQPGYLPFLADIDAIRAYPQLRGMLQRTQIQTIAAVSGTTLPRPADYTMHGANKVSLYRGFDNNGNGSTPRSNSSNAVADVADVAANHSQHSAHSCDSPQPAKSLNLTSGGSGGLYANPDFEPVVAFGSAPEQRASSNSLASA